MTEDQHISVAVDAVVFGYSSASGLSALLVRRRFEPFARRWALPGGFVRDGESLEAAVSRVLEEETGVSIRYLEQLYTFGEPERDPRQRVISVAYFALVRPDDLTIFPHSPAGDVAWFDTRELPPLAFDHPRILGAAIERIRNKITYEPIGFELLEENFPFTDLQLLYETLLRRSIDRRNFKKKIRSLGILEELSERRKQPGSGRPALLYRFNKEKYFKLKQQGIGFEI